MLVCVTVCVPDAVRLGVRLVLPEDDVVAVPSEEGEFECVGLTVGLPERVGLEESVPDVETVVDRLPLAVTVGVPDRLGLPD